MDYKVSGSGTVCPGQYDKISISGSSKIEGKVLCQSFHCSGAAKSHGSIECMNEMHVSGAFKSEHSLKASELHCSGSLKLDGNLTVNGEAKISGSCSIGGRFNAIYAKVSGSISVGEDVEAEELYASGMIKCPGLINAQRVEIKTNGSGINVGQIGGGTIIIEKVLKHDNSVITRLPLFKKLVGTSSTLSNRVDLIEGDNIAVEACHIGKIIGANVAVGEGAEVDRIEYTESIEIHEKAKVGEYVKV